MTTTKQSTTWCPGFRKCLHPSSLRQNEVVGFNNKESTFVTVCNFLGYTGLPSIDMADFARAEHEWYKEEATICNHPLERKHVS